MSSHSLPIPQRLQSLVDAGVWPRNVDDCRKQNLDSWVKSSLIEKLANDEDRIYFYPPPFRTVADVILNEQESEFWNSNHAAPNEIQFDRSLILGDFGLGSDSPIILDYLTSESTPCVKRLKWGPGPKCVNHWVEMASSFSEFADALQLETMGPQNAR